MTEEEAKTKWCPETLSNDRPKQSVGRNTIADVVGTKCIGSECMAWRAIITGTKQVSCGPQGGYKTVNIVSGFCGLAGKP